MRWLALILLSATVAHGATWYVDKDATGSNNGTSWANAWTNMPNVVWASFTAGDDLQIAEGWYNSPPNINKTGTAANPITIRLAQDPARVGHVYITNGINLYANWITVNGAFDTNYSIPAAVADLDTITNNIGLHITTNLEANHGVNCANGNRTGLRLLWTHVYSCGTNTTGFPADNESNENAVSLSDYMTNMVIAYCWFQDNIYGDTINSPRAFGSFGELSIHDCLFYNAGDDVVQINGGFDLYRCKIAYRTAGYSGGHTDFLQTWGNYIRVHHNIVFFWGPPLDEGWSTYCSFGLLQFSNERNGDFLFYNNLLYDQDTNRFTNPGISFTTDAWFAPGKYWATNTLTNIVVANNLFLRPGGSVYGHTFYWIASDSSRGTNGLFVITNCLFANNVVIDTFNQTAGMLQGAPVNFPIVTSNVAPDTDEEGPMISSPDRFKVKNNVITGPNFRVGASNLFNNIIEAQAEFSNITGNKTNRPVFVFYEKLVESPEFDFRIATNDTVLLNAGFDLSAWTNDMPGFHVDLEGNNRFQGTIDIGPYEGAYDGPVDPPAAPTSLRISGKMTFSGKVELR